VNVFFKEVLPYPIFIAKDHKSWQLSSQYQHLFIPLIPFPGHGCTFCC